MRTNFLARFDADNLKKSAIYFAIAVSMIVIAVIAGISDNIVTIAMLFGGMVLFFYALLHPWETVKYYAMMSGIFLILLIFEVIAGIKILVNMDLQGHLAEDIAMSAGFAFIAGIIAGIIGMIRFRKYD